MKINSNNIDIVLSQEEAVIVRDLGFLLHVLPDYSYRFRGSTMNYAVIHRDIASHFVDCMLLKCVSSTYEYMTDAVPYWLGMQVIAGNTE